MLVDGARGYFKDGWVSAPAEQDARHFKDFQEDPRRGFLFHAMNLCTETEHSPSKAHQVSFKQYPKQVFLRGYECMHTENHM